jgi:hypothetical protein
VMAGGEAGWTGGGPGPASEGGKGPHSAPNRLWDWPGSSQAGC